MSDSELKKLIAGREAFIAETEKVKAKVAEAQRKADAVAAQANLEDEAAYSEFNKHQFFVVAGTAKIKNAEAQSDVLLEQIGAAATELAEDKGRALEAVRAARLETFRKAVGPFLPPEKVDEILPFFWVKTSGCIELDQVAANLRGLNKFHDIAPLNRAARVLAVFVPTA
ncbi:MAG: hypothetical protein IPK15_23980 [Verrucomicrobia bacterium]|jgi:hypothetical protein|nr:hypothetical protein [Verrucomicrobiota bacterium]